MAESPLFRYDHRNGFTLVELIMVIALTGAVAVLVSTAVGNQMEGYVHLQQRAQLVQMADTALQKISDDIHNAVPNSVRVSGSYLELVPVVLAAPYRSADDASGTSDILDFTTQDNRFDVFSDLVSSTQSFADGQIVVYNVGLSNGGTPVLGANLYADNFAGDPHVITSPGITIENGSGSDHISLNSAHQFSQRSPNQKMYVVRGALTYHCNSAAGTLTRYSGYSIQQSQPVNSGGSPLSGASRALLANKVTDCVVRYAGSTLSRNAVVSLKLTLSDGNQSTTLMKQVQINNVP